MSSSINLLVLDLIILTAHENGMQCNMAVHDSLNIQPLIIRSNIAHFEVSPCLIISVNYNDALKFNVPHPFHIFALHSLLCTFSDHPKKECVLTISGAPALTSSRTTQSI